MSVARRLRPALRLSTADWTALLVPRRMLRVASFLKGMSAIMIRSSAAALAFTVIAIPALAVEPSMQMTGASFSDACTRASESWISFCNGYIQAAVDSLEAPGAICLPSGTSRTDLVTLAERVISATPELRSMNAFDAVNLVIAKAYPCRK